MQNRSLIHLRQHIFSFPKAAKLKSRKTIEALFKSGKVYKSFPIKLLVLESDFEDDEFSKSAFSVPKRLFKRAVDRNDIKRKMREVYRLERPEFEATYAQTEKQLALMFIYISPKHPEKNTVENKINFLLQRVKKDLETSETKP